VKDFVLRNLIFLKNKIPIRLQWRIKRLLFPNKDGFYIRQKGFCPICEKNTVFSSNSHCLRELFYCHRCGSTSRERAMFLAIEKHYPNWRELKIHESSPNNRGLSRKLKKECRNYSPSQFFPNKKFGRFVKGVRNENLEKLTFNEDDFDLFITQDVVEHIYNPEFAFAEIYRVLKHNGAHIFSVPIVNRKGKTEVWAKLGENGELVFLKTPEYHKSPISAGSPCTIHYGYDIVEMIKNATSGSRTVIENIIDMDKGIYSENIGKVSINTDFIDVFVSFKE
jgi:hypothetical protein